MLKTMGLGADSIHTYVYDMAGKISENQRERVVAPGLEHETLKATQTQTSVSVPSDSHEKQSMTNSQDNKMSPLKVA